MLQPKRITLQSIDAWFSNAFPDKHNKFGLIPNNSFTDKGITGFGITHAELMAKRHSLITIPYVPIIDSKLNGGCPNTFYGVKGNITSHDVAVYLQRTDIEFKKILVTPDSFWKVIEGAIEAGMLRWLFKEVFCYIDEVHCYAIDTFRGDNMLSPFRFVWKFDNKAFGSATPYPVSNPKFKELQHYIVRFKEKIGKILVVEDTDPVNVLLHYLKNPNMFPGRVFIFYNTVTGTGRAIEQSGITDTAVFCADSERNMTCLGGALKYFKESIQEDYFKKFNFFTGRYFEGFDLYGSPLDTMILVTDTAIEHTLVGIEYRGVQAVGRLRLNKEKSERPHKIIHITNTMKEPCNLIPEEVFEEKRYSAEQHINYYNNFIEQINTTGKTDAQNLKGFISNFAFFNKKGFAKLFFEKIDQQVYEATFKRNYNSIESVVKRWEDSHFEVELKHFSLPKISKCRKSDATINKEVIELFEKLKNDPNLYSFAETQRQMRQLQDKHDILFQFYFQYDKTAVEECKYDNNKMRAKLIETSNKNADAQLRIMVAKHFTIGLYTKKNIKKKLQEFYDLLEMKKPDGKRLIATAPDLQRLNMFKIEDTKRNQEHVFIITRVLCSLKQAA